MTPAPLMLYVNPAWRRRGVHSAFLNPWWGNPLSESSLFTKQIYDTYPFDTTVYTITGDISRADLVFAPYPHTWCLRYDQELFNRCVKTAEKANIPILIDGTGDIEYPVNIKNAIILRYGGYRSDEEPGRVEIPLFGDDLLERTREGQLRFRQKTEEKPTVGFAGWAKLSLPQTLRTLAKESPLRFRALFQERYRVRTKGIWWRQKALRLLDRSPLVTLRYHARNTFSGSAKTAEGDLRELREQMVETILSSDYALDVKGDANNTARLFEILSLGRIPVIVDTDRILPFSDKVDYPSFALIVDFRAVNQLPERIAEFHKDISPAQFTEMQRKAREVYVRYFRADAIARGMVEEVRAKLSA